MKIPKVVILMGPTASGKTGMAVKLAKARNGEIISADSRQVFRGMDIGTGKDLNEYGTIPYHLIDVVNPEEEFSVSDFQASAWAALRQISSRNKLPIICGGTGHYIKALIEDYDFLYSRTDLDLAKKLESLPREDLENQIKELGLWESHHWPDDSKRRMARALEKAQSKNSPKSLFPAFNDSFNFKLFYVDIERELIRSKIKYRLQERIDQGMIEEVEGLVYSGIGFQRLERFGLEYKFVSYYLQGQISKEDLLSKLSTEISRYAKRQMTFIRFMEKNGHIFTSVSDFDEFLAKAGDWLDQK